MPAKCHPHINSLSAWESCDLGYGHTCTHVCRHAEALTHISIFNKLGVRTFPQDLHYCYSARPSFNDTPVSRVLAVHVVFSWRSGAYRQDRWQDSLQELHHCVRVQYTHTVTLEFCFQNQNSRGFIYGSLSCKKNLQETRSNPHQHQHVTLISPIPCHISD